MSDWEDDPVVTAETGTKCNNAREQEEGKGNWDQETGTARGRGGGERTGNRNGTFGSGRFKKRRQDDLVKEREKRTLFT